MALAAVVVGLPLAIISASRGGPLAPIPPAAAEASPDGLLGPLGLQRAPRGAVVSPFSLRTLAGQPFSAEEMRGKVALLSFFATWCPTCKAELPALRELAARFRATDFMLLLVNYGEAPEVVRAFATDLEFAHAVLLDPEARVGESLGVRFLPTHFLIGRRGDLVSTGVGPKAWRGPEAARLIGTLLGARG